MERTVFRRIVLGAERIGRADLRSVQRLPEQSPEVFRLAEIDEAAQRPIGVGGRRVDEDIVIAAHSDQNDGLLGDPRHIEDYKNKKLLALEVTANPPVRRILDIVEGRDRAWARPDCHPAYVMSSDAKSLKTDDQGQPVANSLGYRHTWLKMSKPSIEALRQAFLDPLSRIQLQGARPSDAKVHPRITKVSVRGAKFLEDQDVHFSEGFNCVIGGRGSGKSSLLEYVRFAIGPDEPASKGAGAVSLDMYSDFMTKLRTVLAEASLAEDDIASQLGLEKAQVKVWLKRASEAGIVEKLKKPVRYSLVTNQLF